MAEVQLKALLKGVEAEHGALVTCRDPSALEMLLRLGNSEAHQGSIAVMFQKKKQHTTSTTTTAAVGSTAQLLFVKERFARSLEEEVQAWLDPFQTAAAAAASSPTTAGRQTKRGRDDDSQESSLDSDEDSD